MTQTPSSTTAPQTVAPMTAGPRLLDPRNLLTLARKEVRDSLRNRWFILYTLAFAALSLALSSLSLAGTGTVGLAGFGRTAASLVNLVMLIVPLMGLTAGAAALAAERERSTLAYLLSQPVSRLEVVLGKYLGLAVALLASLALGFGLAAAAIAWRSGTADAARFLTLLLLAAALGLAMLSVGFLISALTRRASIASGTAIFIWLVLVFFGDLGLMGSTVIFKLQIAELFRLAMLNPLQVFKLAALHGGGASLDVLGPAGLYATRTYGSMLPTLLGAMLGGWIVLPLILACVAFGRRGAA